MPTKYLSRGFFPIALCLVFSIAAHAQTPNLLGPCTSNCHIGPTTGEIVGIVVGVAAAVTVVTILVIHHEKNKEQSITGCVNLAANGMTITDEKDKQAYTLTGNTDGIKVGDRVKLQGKKVKATGADKTPVWQAGTVTKDFGLCRP